MFIKSGEVVSPERPPRAASYIRTHPQLKGESVLSPHNLYSCVLRDKSLHVELDWRGCAACSVTEGSVAGSD